MQKRFPHPVLVRRLIGMPVLDYDNATIGYVRQVVRSPAGKVLLIVPYSGWFGWAPTTWGKRPVAVPIEAVAILAFAARRARHDRARISTKRRPGRRRRASRSRPAK